MRVKFRVNLGSTDAGRVSLDFRDCCAGVEREVSDVAGNWLVSRGIATEVILEPPASEPPGEINAIPDAPEIGESDSPEIKADAKPASSRAKKQD